MGWLDVIEKSSFFKEGYEKGRKEGEIKGLTAAILLDVQIKFGRDKVRLIRSKVESIDDIRKLKFLKEKILKMERWEGFYSLLIDKREE